MFVINANNTGKKEEYLASILNMLLEKKKRIALNVLIVITLEELRKRYQRRAHISKDGGLYGYKHFDVYNQNTLENSFIKV
uniref:Resolvase/invertase-type recombinase catalytic domain-containing protein n=1 Tax=Strongyloides venezuelensis TaxID=75913 RepID=A0A0K0G6A6_STRVS